MNPGGIEESLPGIEVREPAFGLPAVWIAERDRERAELLGFTVVEPSAVLSTHLQEILRRNADKILGRQDTRKLVENLKKEYPGGRGRATAGRHSYRDGAEGAPEPPPRRDPGPGPGTILESLVDYARVTKNVDVLTEYVRHSLSETIARLYRDVHGMIHAIAIDPQLEQVITAALQNQRDTSPSLGLSPATVAQLHESLEQNIAAARRPGGPARDPLRRHRSSVLLPVDPYLVPDRVGAVVHRAAAGDGGRIHRQTRGARCGLRNSWPVR